MVEPYITIDYHTSATHSQIVKQYERTIYSYAKASHVILICGHSNGAIFPSKSYADRLREEITTIEAEIATDPHNPKLVKKNTETIEQLRHELHRERRHKRDIDSAEPRGTPLPVILMPAVCYLPMGSLPLR
jgi:hypothetical protein